MDINRGLALLPSQENGFCQTEAESNSWLTDRRYLTVLRATKTIAFEYDSIHQTEKVSPFISEYIAGNYDGRPLSRVMLEDGIIYPEDVETAVRFRDTISAGRQCEMTLRLLTPDKGYRWFKMTLTPCESVNQPGIFVGILSDVDAETRQREILRYRAEYDPVSGIFNKQTFFERTARMLEAQADREHFLIRFDIDRFKLVNELYSITEGDRVLRHIGNILKESCTGMETYARMGDDIFCVCLTRSEAETLEFLEELIRQLNECPINFQFVLSAGILPVRSYNGQPVNILCDQAAIAQHTVKGNYMVSHAFYSASMGDRLNREHYIAGHMRKAVQNEEFVVYFQPKYNIRTGRMIGAEALVRWQPPGEEMISPGEFIPLFEQNGLILPLDEHVWELTCRHMKRWKDKGLRLLPISMNVSRLHIHDPEFSAKLVELSRKYGLSPNMMDMEITESAYSECPQTLYGIMERLRQQGFIFSMDDFGSGYSSLNILKDIPVDLVKIDLNFLRESRRGPETGKAVIEGTIQLIHGMGLPIIAEGVETKEQVELLKNAGCTGAQGYYYAKPMPAEEFEKLLEAETG